MEIELEQPQDFELNEKVTLSIDWGSGLHRGKRCQIISFQQNGNLKCAKVLWRSPKYGAKLEEEYGTIFPLLDLKKL